MFCILFTNLELRWMLSIFQSNNNGLEMRSILCRFNFVSYGSFLLVYPVLLFTNLNNWLFIGISLLFLPQIYTNAQKGIRPDLNHPYYIHFLMARFIIIVTFEINLVLHQRISLQYLWAQTWLFFVRGLLGPSYCTSITLFSLVFAIVGSESLRTKKDFPQIHVTPCIFIWASWRYQHLSRRWSAWMRNLPHTPSHWSRFQLKRPISQKPTNINENSMQPHVSWSVPERLDEH